MHIAAADLLQPLWIAVQLPQYLGRIRAVEGHVNHCIGPVELTREFRRAGRVAEQDGSSRRAFVVTARYLLPVAGILRLVDAGAVCNVIAAALEDLRQHEAEVAGGLKQKSTLLSREGPAVD